MDNLAQKFGVSIGSKIFTLNDQYQFARFSGDSNPIHIDPILARRTMAGECIVHGVNGLMCAINYLAKHNRISINHFDVKFSKTIPLGIQVNFFWDSGKNKLTIVYEDAVYTSILVTLGSILKDSDISNIKTAEPLVSPRNKNLEECSEIIREELIYRGNIEVGKILFPYLFERYGDIFAIELALTSEIVGMQIPGLNSLFLSMKGKFSEVNSNSFYELVSCNSKFGVMKLIVQGRRLIAQIEAFYRPSLINLPSIERIAKSIKCSEFKNVNALIIGGSRGLGEITAKIITSGGGKVTISYNLGEEDARNLQQELLNFGGSCDIIQLKIEDKFYLPEAKFNQIYYFPTPKVKTEDPNIPNLKLENLYQYFYVDAFRNLLNQVLKRNMLTSIFYPSSTFLDNPPKNFSKYVDAKLKGEQVCREFQETKFMQIICPRLPRMATDQTLGLLTESFKDSVNVMYPLIQTMAH